MEHAALHDGRQALIMSLQCGDILKWVAIHDQKIRIGTGLDNADFVFHAAKLRRNPCC